MPLATVRRHHLFQQSDHRNHNLHGQNEQAQKIPDRQRSRQLELEADRDSATMLARAGDPARLCQRELAFMARSISDPSITAPNSAHPGYEDRQAAMCSHDGDMEKHPAAAEASTRYSHSDTLFTMTAHQS